MKTMFLLYVSCVSNNQCDVKKPKKTHLLIWKVSDDQYLSHQVKFIQTKNTLIFTLCESFRRNTGYKYRLKKKKQLPEPTQTHAHRPHQRTHLQYTHTHRACCCCAVASETAAAVSVLACEIKPGGSVIQQGSKVPIN